MNVPIHRSYGAPCRQRGAATLIVAVVLLFLITILSVITAQTVVVENQVTGNQQREMQAFNAAQAGLDYFMLLLGLEEIDPETGQWSSDSNDPFRFIEYSKVVHVNGACQEGDVAQFALDSVRVPDMPGFYDITASGFSADCLARRVISQRVVRGVSEEHEMERVPVVAGGSVIGGGSAHNVANPENNFTIWSGAPHDPANSHTLISDPANPCDYNNQAIRLQECRPTGNRQGLIRDNSLSVIASDMNLQELRKTPDEFFRNFMGRPPVDFSSHGLAQRVSPAEAEKAITDVMEGGRYWVDGPLNIQGGTIGCSEAVGSNQECGRGTHPGQEKPSLVIVNGDFSVQGNFVAYGVIYVRGNLKVNGTMRVYGSIIMEDDVGGNGNVDVFFSSSTLAEIEPVRVDLPTVVPGTWRDWTWRDWDA
ncbi:pilus assembly PilX N-terminal domain-containing protein [Thioalkalivibrio sp.]|uniref:pilus assembly PilX family protein n=1 Tax=Thioalkalivibrio sp. TaxID=2093813 RepID=UPI0012D6DC7C|nr:pilus assembly PilX N-terminal domain-containing protein [Thioalkalivibrio sp.]TVP81507.1 MAG: hypothetical protein EA346_04850 [Thioalkalivibrio sp.]